MVTDSASLPDDIDPELWFECCHHPGARDYLLNAGWHTFPGRMPAWCATRQVSFRVSKSELPSELPTVTRQWVAGFLAGNVPWQPGPADIDDGLAMAVWQVCTARFLASGHWPLTLGSDRQRQWSDDSQVLAELGGVLLADAVPLVEVRIPQVLAEQAVAAWTRHDEGRPPVQETAEQRTDRHRAGVLALIGLAIEQGGWADGDVVVVELRADLVGTAIAAADS